MPVNVPGTITWSNVQSPIAGEVNSAPALNSTTITPLVNRTNYLKNITEPHTGTGVERHRVLSDISPAYNSLRSITDMTTGDGFWVKDSAAGSLDFFVYDAASGLAERIPDVIRSGTGAWINAKRNTNGFLEHCVSAQVEVTAFAPQQISSDPGGATSLDFFTGASPSSIAFPTAALGQTGWVVDCDAVVNYRARFSGSQLLSFFVDFGIDGSTETVGDYVIGSGASGYSISPSSILLDIPQQLVVKKRFIYSMASAPTLLTPYMVATKGTGMAAASPAAAFARTHEGIMSNRCVINVSRIFF